MTQVVFGLLYNWKIQTWPIIRFLTESVTYGFFYLLVFDRIHDVQDLQQKYRPTTSNLKQYISLYTWGYFSSMCSPNISWVFAAKKLIFLFHLTIEVSPIWSSSRVWQLNMLKIVFGWARIIFLETLPNNMWWCRCWRFSDPETHLFSVILQLWSLESLWPLKLSSSPYIRMI